VVDIFVVIKKETPCCMCPLGAALAIPGRVRMFGWLRRWPECGSPLGADIDLVPTAEIADIKDSSLSTPYNAWALAARYRQRAFVFWTYVSALAEDPLVRVNAEDLARKALSDGNLLRRERRLAWRAERRIGAEGATAHDGIDESASAALLESLLLKDMMTWSQGLPPPT